jgi:type IV pilus assembly protein PilO
MSRKIRMLLSGLALLVVVALAWFMLISPLRADIAETDSAISAEQVRLAAAQAKLAQAEVTRAEGKKNQALLLELAKMVPDSNQVPSLLVQIQDLADQSGIEFISVTPGEPKESEGFKIIPLTLTFGGTYFDLSDFAYRAEQLVAGPGRLLTVKSIQLQLGANNQDDGAAKKGSPDLNVSMTLYAFSMDQAAAGQPAATASPTAQPGATDTAANTTSTAQ